MSAEIIKLAQQAVSTETIEMLKLAIAAHERGEAIGAAIIWLLPGRHFVLDLGGAAKTDPTRLRGILNKFDDELAKLPADPSP